MKTIKQISIYLFFLVASTMPVACDDDSSGKGQLGSNGDIVGTWCDSGSTEDLLYTFAGDGSYLCEVHDYYNSDTYTEEWGSYETNGDKLTLYWTDIDGESGVEAGTYSVSGNELTIVWDDGYEDTWTRYTGGGSEPEGDDNALLVGYWECNYNGSYYSYAFDSDGTYNYEYISAYGTNNVSEYGKYVYRKDLQQVYFEVINTTSQFGGDHSNECILSSDGRSFRMGELTYRKSY